MSTQSAAVAPRRAPAKIDPQSQGERFFGMYQRWMAGYAEEFRGLTIDAKPRAELFRLAPTGHSTEAIQKAAQAFLDALTTEERATCCFEMDSKLWRGWSNIHRNVMRHGICLADLDDARRSLALDVLRAGMSAQGFQSARDAMRLNEHLAELTGKPDQFGEWFYYLSFFGTPSVGEPWGWQWDGHHCNVNCFVVGDQMTLTPTLFGAEPVSAASGVYAGTRILAAEEAAGWRLMASLTAEQQSLARLGIELPFDGQGSGFQDNVVVPYQGISYAKLSAAQQAALVDLVALFVGRMPMAHAALKMAEVRAHLDETWFAWIGLHDETSPFYYRVHSPVVWLEYFNQPFIALPGKGFSRHHAHGLMRTPNGNDYGRAWLAQYRKAG